MKILKDYMEETREEIPNLDEKSFIAGVLFMLGAISEATKGGEIIITPAGEIILEEMNKQASQLFKELK